jgi:hypothetical protein
MPKDPEGLSPLATAPSDFLGGRFFASARPEFLAFV